MSNVSYIDMKFNESEYDKMSSGQKKEFENTIIKNMIDKYISIYKYLNQASKPCDIADLLDAEEEKQIENYLIAYMDKINVYKLDINQTYSLIRSEKPAPLAYILSSIKYDIADILKPHIDTDELTIEKEVDKFIYEIKTKFRPKIHRQLSFVKNTLNSH